MGAGAPVECELGWLCDALPGCVDDLLEGVLSSVAP
jgi:hypothetical protein